MKNNKTIIWIASILVLGAGGYAFYRWWKNRKPQEQESNSTNSGGTGTDNSTNSGGTGTDNSTNSGGTGTGATSEAAKYLTTSELVNKFRQWVNDKYPKTAKAINLSPTGKLNSYVEKAWNTNLPNRKITIGKKFLQELGTITFTK